MERRRFRKAERSAIYRADGGRCSKCGSELGLGWHADHVAPWSKGGATDVINGQALCATCNLKKGVRMSDFLFRIFAAAWSYRPREWQTAAFEKYIGDLKKFWLLNATPRAGKMPFGVAVAKFLISTGRITRVIIVVPTTQLKIDWAKKMAEAGIQIDPNFDTSLHLNRDFCGVVICYATVLSSMPDMRKLCASGKTLVIFDEIHHLAEKAGWGDAALAAFEDTAAHVMGTTGTAFRREGKMAFVKFNEVTGKLETDFDYPYRQALHDKVVRAIHFPMWEAAGIFRYIQNGEELETDFSEDRSPEEWNKALRLAVDPTSGFLRDMVRQANAQLHSKILRGGGDREACGIFFGNTIEGLEYIQRKIFDPMDVKSMVIHSKKDDPGTDLETVRNDPSIEWVIAADMLTEGIEVNRARVGVWGKASTSQLKGNQAKGRILPRVKTTDTEAWWYSPEHPDLKAQALEQMNDVAYVLGEEEKERDGKKPTGGGGDETRSQFPGFELLEAEGRESDRIIHGSEFDRGQMAYADEIRAQAGLVGELSADHVAMVLKAAGSLVSIAVEQPPAKTMAEQRKEASDRINRLVGRAVRRLMESGRFPNTDEGRKAAFPWVTSTYLSPLDNVYNNSGKVCTLDQLRVRERRMEELLKELTRATPVGR